MSNVETFTGGFPVDGCQDCQTLVAETKTKAYFFGSIAHHMRTEHQTSKPESHVPYAKDK